MTTEVSFLEYLTEWLHEVREGNPSTTELGHRFARKLIAQWLDVTEESDDLIFCDGAGDGGIDVAYLHRSERVSDSTTEAEAGTSIQGDTWYLVQSKYGKAFQGVGTLLTEGQKVLETLDGGRSNLSSLAMDVLERLNNFRRQASELDHIVLVFATEETLTDEEKRALDDIRAMGRDRLETLFDVEAVSVETIYLRNRESSEAECVKVQLDASLTPCGDDLLVGHVSLLNLYRFLKEYRIQTQDLDRLYEQNVRRFLGNRGRVNKAMQATLKESPELFGLYNNGIAIVAANFACSTDGKVTLSDPYIVNGCQTTRTIWEVCHQRLEAGGTGRSAELAEWREKAGRGVVVTKIVKVGSNGEEALQKITQYTNSQNAVREKDFLALTSNFRTWAEQMGSRYDTYLETQRGGWDSRRALQRQNPNLRPQFKVYANAFDLVKVYGAGWLREAGTAFGKNGPFAPGGQIYETIVDGNVVGEPFGIDDLYAAYLLQRDADEIGFGRKADKESRKQTRFLFYMVVLELLRDVVERSNGNRTPSPKELTRALLRLETPSQEEASSALLGTALEVIDQYLNEQTDNSVFKEPAYQAHNNDLNRFLKWDQLGKTESSTPRFRQLLSTYKYFFGQSAAGKVSQRELVAAAVAGANAH